MKAARLTGSLLVVPSRGDAAPHDDARISALPAHRRPLPRRGDDGHTDVSLRINTARHLRLALAAQHLGLSASGLMVVAIDRYIENVLPNVPVDQRAFFQQGHAAARRRAPLSFIRIHPNCSP
jgi:hypothetical protein